MTTSKESIASCDTLLCRCQGRIADGAIEAIDLSGVAAITGFTDLSNNHMSQVSSDAVIDDGSGNTITLESVSLGALDAGDFLF